jgi:hypothetical protein
MQAELIKSSNLQTMSVAMFFPASGREYQVEANHRGYIVDHEDEATGARITRHQFGMKLFMIDVGWYAQSQSLGTKRR